jgi:hypothetical protein
MNQHDYVKECLEFYEEAGFIPGAKWEDAHYPAPNGKGETTISMLHDHHQVQGLWQSKEYEQCCFFSGDAKQFLTEGPFVSGWFELWDIYDKYSTLHSSGAGKKSAELGVGVHGRSAEQMKEDGRKGGAKSAELGVGIHAPGVRSKGGKTAAELGAGFHAPGMQSKGGTKAAGLGVGAHAPGMQAKGGTKGGKTTSSQKWMCLVTGHISNAGALSRWQNARGIDTSLRVKVSG